LKRIVCDTGPLLHLREAGLLELLRAMGSIEIPPNVYSELVGLDVFWREQKPTWLKLVLEVHGSLGVVLWGAATGHFQQQEAEAALEALAGSSLWISSRVLDEARAALRQIFA